MPKKTSVYKFEESFSEIIKDIFGVSILEYIYKGGFENFFVHKNQSRWSKVRNCTKKSIKTLKNGHLKIPKNVFFKIMVRLSFSILSSIRLNRF